LCEAAAWCKHQGITLCGQMEKLYQKYGYYKEGLSTITLKGQEGIRKISKMMERIRSEVPEQIGGLKVLQFRDYREDMLVDYKNGTKSKTGLPASNVLYFELEEGAWCCIRPSGTEPKIKFYIGVCGSDENDAVWKLDKITQAVLQLVE